MFPQSLNACGSDIGDFCVLAPLCFCLSHPLSRENASLSPPSALLPTPQDNTHTGTHTQTQARTYTHTHPSSKIFPLTLSHRLVSQIFSANMATCTMSLLLLLFFAYNMPKNLLSALSALSFLNYYIIISHLCFCLLQYSELLKNAPNLTFLISPMTVTVSGEQQVCNIFCGRWMRRLWSRLVWREDNYRLLRMS